jgi:hypothetical protein
VIKQIGRPKGRRDQKQRKRRVENILILEPHFSTFLTLSFGRPQKIISRKAIESSAGSLQEDQDPMTSWFELMNTGERESPSDCANSFAGGYFKSSPVSIESCQESSPGCDAMVDEQLNAWNERLWISPQNPDPFRDDWAPMSCSHI